MSKFPVIEALAKALPKDKPFEKALEKLVEEEANSSYRSRDHESSVSWPGWDRYWKRNGDLVSWVLDLELQSAKDEMEALHQVYNDGEDTPEFVRELEKALLKAVKDTIDDDGAEDIVANTVYDLRESDAESRDPYGYRGLSRRDFYGSADLRTKLIRLAHQNPDMRKDLVPMLRKDWEDRKS